MLPIPNQFRCCDCERDFNTKESLSQHLEDSPAHPHKKFQRKTGCNMCRRTFHCKAALEQHKSSIRHQPLCHIKCLASSKCKKTFDCPSAQLHHLESGTCPSRCPQQLTIRWRTSSARQHCKKPRRAPRHALLSITLPAHLLRLQHGHPWK